MPSPFLKAKAPKISRIFEKDMAEAQKNDGKDVKVKAKAKDKNDSKILKSKHKKMNEDIAPSLEKVKLQEQNRAKDTSDVEININVDGTQIYKIKYLGRINKESIINYVKNKIWRSKNLESRFGKFENFNVEILKRRS